MTRPIAIKPVDTEALRATKPSFVDWYTKQEQMLLKAATEAGFEDLNLVAFHDKPVGNWKYKKLLRSGERPIARYWLSLRRPRKSSILKVPRFNLECGEELANKFQEMSLKKDIAATKLQEVSTL